MSRVEFILVILTIQRCQLHNLGIPYCPFTEWTQSIYSTAILAFPNCMTKSTSTSLSGSALLKIAINHDRTCSCTNHSRTPSGGRAGANALPALLPARPTPAGTLAINSFATASRSVSHQDSPSEHKNKNAKAVGKLIQTSRRQYQSADE